MQFGFPTYYVEFGVLWPCRRRVGKRRMRSLCCHRTCTMGNQWGISMEMKLYIGVHSTLSPRFGHCSYHRRVSPKCVPRVAMIRDCGHALAFWTENLDQQTPSLCNHCMIAGSHQLCAKLQNHHSGGWGHIVAPLFSALLVSHGVFSLLGVRPAAISDRVSLSALDRNYWLGWFGW